MTRHAAGSTRLPAERRSDILTRARERGTVRTTELAAAIGVSEMTIRRDIDRLVDDGLLDRVHGGATAPGALRTEEPGFASKLGRQQGEKDAIAAEALSLVEPGSAIGLSAGTTTWRLANLLTAVPSITVVTNSLAQAALLHHAGAAGPASVVITGGVPTPSDALVGPIAVSAIDRLNLDVLFLGVHGMHERTGYTTPNMLEAETDRALIRAARRVVVLADHSKWDCVGLSSIAPLSAADIVVSDEDLPEQAERVLTEHGVEVRRARSRP